MKNKKSIIFICIMTLFVTIFTACGKKENGKAAEEENYVYLPEFHELNGEYEDVQDVVSVEDRLFFSGTEYEEETNIVSASLYEYDVETGEEREVASNFKENSRIIQMVSNPTKKCVDMIIYRFEQVEEEIASFFELWTYDIATDTISLNRDVTDLVPEDGYLYDCLLDGAGNYYFNFNQRELSVYNNEFTLLGQIPIGDMFSCVFQSKEGDVYAAVYGNEGIEFKKVDVASKSLGQKISMDEWSIQKVCPGYTSSILMNTADNFAVYDFDEKVEKKLFSWVSVNINQSDVTNFGELANGNFWVVTTNYAESSITHELVFIRKEKASEVSQKQEIYFGCMSMDDVMKQAVIAFNKTNENYHITVVNYGDEYGEEADTKFRLDFTSGENLDLVDVMNFYDTFSDKGGLEDLYPYMEKSNLKKEDFFPNVLDAYGKDGKLYAISPEFMVLTVIAKKSEVGDVKGWTLSEMLDFADEKGVENLFEYPTRWSVLSLCLDNNSGINEFVNWETGKCSFDSDEFIHILELAKSLPADYDYQEEHEGVLSRINNNRLYLIEAYINEVQSFQMYRKLMGENITFIGYPNQERQGNYVRPSGGFVGISSNSKNKEGAWEFLQMLLSQEYQDSLNNQMYIGFPIRISATEKQLEEAMKPEYTTDENGNQIEMEKCQWQFDDFDVSIYAATQEEADELMTLLQSATYLQTNVYSEMSDIIIEEAEPFFKGQKTAGEVANIIQNRIQVYMNENR